MFYCFPLYNTYKKNYQFIYAGLTFQPRYIRHIQLRFGIMLVIVH